MNAQSIDKFHKTRLGYIVFGLVELGLTLLVLNWALDTGSLWIWALTFILLFGFVQNFVHVMTVHKK
jgi:heme/copper-type cytochrome/quinol oxidase subunit 4